MAVIYVDFGLYLTFKLRRCERGGKSESIYISLTPNSGFTR